MKNKEFMGSDESEQSVQEKLLGERSLNVRTESKPQS